MAGQFTIADGNPIWASGSIIPSATQPVSPSTAPPWADPQSNPPPTAPRVDVYVRIDSTGPAGVACPTGPWNSPTPFSQYVLSNAATRTELHDGWTLTVNSGGGASLVKAGVASPSFGTATLGRKAWGWSPDGHFFGYAWEPGPAAGNGKSWRLVVVALEDALQIDGAPIVPGTVLQHPNVSTTTNTYSTVFDASTFGWVGGSAIFTSGVNATGTSDMRHFFCFRTATPSYDLDQQPHLAGRIYRASPCGSRIAYLDPATAAAPVAITFMSTQTGSSVPAKRNNVSVQVSTDGPAPTITTDAHTLNGVTVHPGTGANVTIDDPDDSQTFGGLTVHVDRVKASTLPSANLGVKLVGAAISGEIPYPGSRWVQVPNRVGWDNQGESHWCLLAQAYDETAGIHRAWDGQISNPPAFPVSPPDPGNDRCAQRNIHIAP
jgi:hypothetical protein